MPLNARFCRACGHTLPTRAGARQYRSSTTSSHAVPAEAPTQEVAPADVEPAGGGVRCAAHLLDLAAMMSPAMPLCTAAAVLGVVEVVYIVVPVAFVAVWLWMQIWQGYTGNTFGKAMLGLRLVRAADHRPPGFRATVGRSLAFTATLGLAGLPVLLGPGPRTGWHDQVSGLAVLDVAAGANPLGSRQQTTLRPAGDRGLNRVHSPIPVTTTRRG